MLDFSILITFLSYVNFGIEKTTLINTPMNFVGSECEELEEGEKRDIEIREHVFAIR